MKISKKHISILSFLFLVVSASIGQSFKIGSDSANPNPSAILDVSDTTKGILFPRLTAIQRAAISSPTDGLMIFQTDGNRGIWSYDGVNGIGWSKANDTTVNILGLPVGTILSYGGDTSVVPNGFLLCNGVSLDTGLFSNLFSIIGYAWGGSGTSFNVPDLRGRFIRGADLGAGNDPNKASRVASAAGGNVGDLVGSYQLDAFQGHYHDISVTGTNTQMHADGGLNEEDVEEAGPDDDQQYTLSDIADQLTATAPETDGANGTPRTSLETRPVNLYVNYIICYDSEIATEGGTSSVGSLTQTLSFSEPNLSISGGNNVDLTPLLNLAGTPDLDSVLTAGNNAAGIDIVNTGSLGIGTASPNTELHINESSGTDAEIQFTSGATGTTDTDGFFVGSYNDTAKLLNREAAPILFGTNGISHMGIDANGRVGIANGNPDSLLDVAGGINALALKINDYTLPGEDGAANTFLRTDGSGNITFESITSGDSDWTVAGGVVYNNADRFIVGNTTPNANVFAEFETPATTAYQSALRIDHLYTGAAQTFGISTSLNQNGTGEKYGVHNYVRGQNGTQTNPIYGVVNQMTGGNTELVYGSYSTVSSTGTGIKYGEYNEVAANASATSPIYGEFNELDPNNTSIATAQYNLVNSTGTATKYGTFNDVRGSSAQSGNIIGTNNAISPSFGEDVFGIKNTISGNGSGEKYGTHNLVTAGAGQSNDMYGSHSTVVTLNTGYEAYGAYNSVSGSTNNNRFGTFNEVSNTATHNGFMYGSYNNVTETGSGSSVGEQIAISAAAGSSATTTGELIQITGDGIGARRGLDINITKGATGSTLIYGIDQNIDNSSTGEVRGNYTIIDANGTGVKYGSYNRVTSNGSSANLMAGYYSLLSTNGAGTSYGFLNNYSGTSGGGLRYGFYTNNEDANYFSGKVGINDNTPSFRLEIEDNTTTDPMIYLQNTNTNGDAAIRLRGANTEEFSFGVDASTTNNDFVISNASTLGTSTRLTINGNTGNVGIGTILPDTKLHVDGGSDAGLGSGGYFQINGTSTTNLIFDDNEIMARNNGVKSPLYIQNDGGDIFMHAAQGNETQFTILDNGRVAIGTASPAQLFHIETSTSDAIIHLESDTDNNNENDNPRVKFIQDGGSVIGKVGLAGSTGVVYGNAISNSVYLGHDDNYPLQLYTNQTARLTIEAAGDVGIGTTNPSSELDVDGDIETGSGDAFYFGDPNTNGSWRITRSGNNLSFQRREGGSWITKTNLIP